MKRMKLIYKLSLWVMVLALLAGCVPLQSGSEQLSLSVEPPSEHAMGQPDELGTVNFPVSCTTDAQAEFSHGVALLHSFWFAPAIESFTKVTELDPTCAMGHWGVAMSLMGNPFTWPPSPKALEDGWVDTEKAIAAGAVTSREQAYIAAIAAFYKDAATIDHRTRALAYESAMADLAAQFPEDTEATIFYALALNATALPTDKEYTNQLKAAELLETIFVEQPDHPGVAHYLIHSYDYPAIADRGLNAADRYAGIAPAAPHALHMPSHIFTRLGLWQESVDTNMASASAANEELTATHVQGAGSYNALHSMDYQMYAYLQLGQDVAAQQLLDEIYAIEQLDVENFAAAYAFAAMPARYALERGQWAEAANLKLHPATLAWDKFPQAEAVLVFARALGAARSGDVAAANQDLARLHELHATLVEAKNTYWAGQVEIQATEVAAWIALAEDKRDEALTLMRQAVALEDATDKHPVTPGPLNPAHELLGELLLALDDPAAALQEFEASHKIEPNRFKGWYNAAHAAYLVGDTAKAQAFYTELVDLAATADTDRPELASARAFLGQ